MRLNWIETKKPKHQAKSSLDLSVSNTLMEKYRKFRFTGFGLPLLLVVLLGFSPAIAEAHRSGCHRWHSCPSDSGSYTCGDLGYPCKYPTYSSPTSTKKSTPRATVKPSITPAPVTTSAIVGVPTTREELLNCAVVGNMSSKIYHLKGSKHIKGMNLKKKQCFATAAEAVAAGLRASKN